jgi:hypothetical protein
MSTHYAPFNKIRARDLFDGRLEKFGVREQSSKCLTDVRNYLEVYIDDGHLLDEATSCAPQCRPRFTE